MPHPHPHDPHQGQGLDVGAGAAATVVEVFLSEVCHRNSLLDQLCLAAFDAREEDLMGGGKGEREGEKEVGGEKILEREWTRDCMTPPRSIENHNHDHNHSNHNITATSPPSPLPPVPNTYQSLVSQWEVNNEWDPDPTAPISNVGYLTKIIALGGTVVGPTVTSLPIPIPSSINTPS